MRSPKLDVSSSRKRHYQYYAGFSDGFVEDTMTRAGVTPDDLILDPWNGSGTTTATAAASGLRALGFDINPVAVLIGRSGILQAEINGSLRPLATEICKLAIDAGAPLRSDLLDTWFGPATARELRALECAIYRLLVDADGRDETTWSALPQSPLAAFFYVALFDSVRQLVRQFVPSNPTWIKRPDGRRLGIRRYDLHAAFKASVGQLADRLVDGQLTLTRTTMAESSVSIDWAKSTDLPVEDASVDLVLSSPPYCTRLDYVKATLPELAVLGFSQKDVRALRDEMIGTPTMVPIAGMSETEQWGEGVNRLLEAVTAHSSHASSTYYRKYYLQYFAGMWNSLRELRRVVKPEGCAVLVVQDSYYKEIHVDLPTLIGEMAVASGWAEWSRTDFDVSRTMASIHPGSRNYRSQFRAIESAVLLAN